MEVIALTAVKYLPLCNKVRLSLTSKTNFLFPVPAVLADIQTVEKKRKAHTIENVCKETLRAQTLTVTLN